MIDAEHPSDVEATEDVWSGDNEGKSRNLELDIDHPKAAGADETIKFPESLPDAEAVLSESEIRRLVWDIACRSRKS